jgi:hypothetical protein
MLGRILAQDKGFGLHVIVYSYGNAELARKRALRIKKYIISNYPEVAPDRLILSWFGEAEVIQKGEKTYVEKDSCKFLTAVR